MNLGVHAALAELSRYKSTDRVTFDQHICGRRGDVRKTLRTINRVAEHAKDTNSGLMITVVRESDGVPLWKLLGHAHCTVFVAGPVYACQTYLHSLEGLHGHRR